MWTSWLPKSARGARPPATAGKLNPLMRALLAALVVAYVPGAVWFRLPFWNRPRAAGWLPKNARSGRSS